MNRRKALKQMAVLTGGALSLSTISAVLGGCRAKPDTSNELRTLTDSQNSLVTTLSERIIPATDTPGAKAAGVNQYIDKMLTDWHTEKERNHFLEGLSHTDNVSNELADDSFINLSKENQIRVLRELERQAKANPMHESHLQPFFRMLKELTIVGYYTSEVGATKELTTAIVPGSYEGCIPYTDVGTAWSNAGT